ncbi:hypothetical protein VM98_36100, partial [Streptomyces rubellomurinus subsp. indigoferus]
VKFPHGITGVADYIHANGLKLGIYESAGTLTCAGYPGSFDHEQQDAASFAPCAVASLCGRPPGPAPPPPHIPPAGHLPPGRHPPAPPHPPSPPGPPEPSPARAIHNSHEIATT